MGCKFCLTGRYGLQRNLFPSEIVGQITALRFNTPEGKDVKSIVMMGMGEPLANYENTLKAIRIITSDVGPGVFEEKNNGFHVWNNADDTQAGQRCFR